MTAMVQAAGWALLLLSWLVPNHYRPWVSYHNELVAFVAIALLTASHLLEAKPFPLPPLALWVAACVVIVWCQWAAGLVYFAGDALICSIYLVAMIGTIGLGYADSNARPKLLARLTQVVWLAALASAMIGLLQWLSLESVVAGFTAQSDIGSRPMANVAQPNQLATLLLMGIAALSFTFERHAIGTLAYLLALSFMSFVLVLTESRTGVLCAVTLAMYALLKRRQHVSRIRAKFVAAWAAVVVTGFSLLPSLNNALLIGGSRGLSLTDNNGRWHMWKQIAHAVWEAPWFGYGWNQTVAAHAVGAAALPGELSISHAHSVLFDVVAWNGLPLGLLLCAAGIYWFVTRTWRVKEPSGIYAMACLIPFAVHSLLEFPFAYSYFLLTAGLLVGSVETSLGVRPLLLIQKRWMAGVLAAWVAFGGYHVYEYFLIEEDFRIVRFENLRVGRTPSDYVVPKLTLTSHLATMLTVARVPARPGMSPEQLEDLKQVARRFPFGALTFRYAVALGLNGDPEGASRQMQAVCGMYGKKYCQVTTRELRELQAEKYPQLKAVRTPETDERR